MGVKPKKAKNKKPRRAPAPPPQGKHTDGSHQPAAPAAFSRAVIDCLGDPSLILKKDSFRILAANRAAAELYGYSKAQLEKMSLEELVYPGKAESLRAKFSGPKIRKELQQRCQDGTRITVETTPALGSYSGKTYSGEAAWLCVLHEISARASLVQALLESDATHREVIENASDIIYTHDLQGNFTSGNRAVTKILGYSRSETVAMNIRDVVVPEDREIAKQATLAKLSGEPVPNPYRLRVHSKEGKVLDLEVSTRLVYRDGKPFGVQGIARDISERKRAEDELRASEERFRQLFQRNLAGVYVSTLGGKILDCNESFAKIFGYDTREEVMQANANSFYFSPLDRDEYLGKLRKDRLLSNMETLCRKRDGSELWVLENVVMVQGPLGEDLIEGTLVDITTRKSTETRLIESESKFRGVADTAASAIYIHNGKQFLYVNRASEEISGYTADELMCLNPFEIVHPEDRPLVLERGQARVSGQGAPDRYEYRIKRKDGSHRWVDFSAGIIQFEGQQAIIGTAFDITERKRVEAMQSALFRISEQATAEEDVEGFLVSIHSILRELMDARNLYVALYNEATQEISYPYYVDEADAPPTGSYPVGRGFTEYVLRTGSHLLATPEVTARLRQEGEVERVGTDCVDWLGVPLKTGNKTVGVLAVQSYSETIRYNEQQVDILNFVSQHIANAIQRKRNEEARRESDMRFRTMVHSAVYGIYRSSPEDNFIEVNPALVNMLGYDTAEEVLALKLSGEVYAMPDERTALIRQHAHSGRVDGVEVKWRRKDGRYITVRLSGRVELDANDKPVFFEMIAEDVTERRALEDQLRQSQKMEAIGRLAGGVAHDFNNLLTVIKGYSELMLDELKEADPMRAEVDEIRKAADRAATLTRQLLAFSRQQVLAPKVIDLNSVVSNMDKLLTRLLGEDIGLYTVLEASLGRVKADPGQIEQVVMNLAVNARDAMPRGGKLTIETANVELDENYAHEHVGARAGNYVMLAVSDNGTGMSPEVRQRIFEPFFTTKELGKGTGLGLSTVYGIVKQSEGYIWVYSEPEHGTSFKVYLPRVEGPADVIAPRLTRKPTFRGTETVLLVEDEDGVRALVRQVLHKHGYKVLEARHGGEALLHCERHTGPIQLLLTDVVLEQMGGPELARRLAGIRPDMRVLYISGYTDDAIIHHGVLTEGTAFLQKPFTTEALARKIRQVLDN